MKKRRISHRHNKKFKIAVTIVIICMALLVAFLIYRDQAAQGAYKVAEREYSEPQQNYSITYKGEEYDFNSSIESVLLIGVVSRGELKAQESYGVDARADNIDLIIMDRQNHSVKILPISRDTMTEITKYTVKGYESSSYVDHLGFAFSYGDGGKASCDNVCDAVSTLLYGIDVRYYICTNLDSIAFANDILGGVKVQCPNNDLSGRYPEMTEGARIKLNDSNVGDFLRYRNTDEDYSNNGRMERQRAFLDGFVDQVKGMAEDDYMDMWEQLKADDSNILTNMSKSHFAKLIKRIDDYDYDPSQSNLKIEGTDKVEDGHDVFYANEKKLKQLVVDTFYDKR